MAIIQSNKSEAKFERKQVVRLPKNGIYGGMLARYSLPKMYESKYGQKEKIALGFVVTHDQAYRQLSKFSGAFCMPTNNLFYDPATRKISNLTQVIYALCGGKKSKEEVASTDVYDWDMFVGRPVSLLIECNEKPDANGLYGHRVTGIEPADDDLRKAIKPLWDTKVIKTNEKTGLQYLASPAEQYEDDDTPPAPADENVNFDEEPF